MVDKLGKGERTAVLARLLCGKPNQLISLSELADSLNAAKSTLSEDAAAIKKAFSQLDLGVIETIPGANGGIRWRPGGNVQWQTKIINDLCAQLADPARILPGGYLFTSDLCTDAKQVEQFASLFAHLFADREPTVVLTVEMKGITLAYATARYLGVPLAIARKELPGSLEGWPLVIRQERTEGPTININYETGSHKRVQTMALPHRSLPKQARALIIDDFMRAGGTAHGLEELVQEFGGTTVGCGVLVATREPEQKLINDYFALALLENVDADQQVVTVKPGNVMHKTNR